MWLSVLQHFSTSFLPMTHQSADPLLLFWIEHLLTDGAIRSSTAVLLIHLAVRPRDVRNNSELLSSFLDPRDIKGPKGQLHHVGINLWSCHCACAWHIQAEGRRGTIPMSISNREKPLAQLNWAPSHCLATSIQPMLQVFHFQRSKHPQTPVSSPRVFSSVGQRLKFHARSPRDLTGWTTRNNQDMASTGFTLWSWRRSMTRWPSS